MKRIIKVLHTLGAIGIMGGFAAYLILAFTAPTESPVAFAAVRAGIAAVSRWLLVPSLLIVLVSGLLSIAAHNPFMNAPWVWIKAATGLGVFEGTLGIESHARTVAALAAQAVTGGGDAAQLADLLRTERLGIWLMLLLALANVVLGVWRPRLRVRRRMAAAKDEC